MNPTDAQSDTSSRSLPAHLIRAIRNFPKPHDPYFKLARSNMLWRQLVESDPVLALLFARGEDFGGIRSWPLLLASKEATCGSVGFPGNERTVRLLRRFVIDPEHAIRDLLLLRYLLAHEPWAFDVLEAWQTICLDDIVHLAVGLEDFERWGDLNAIEWFFRLPAPIRHFIGRLYGESESFDSVLVKSLIGSVKSLSDFQNPAEAISWLADYAGAIERIELAEAEVDEPDWPEPPIPGTETIVPIQNLEELESVSQSQQQHLDAQGVLDGESYFYRVLSGPPSTLQITFENGCWGLSKHQGQDGINVQDPSIQQEIENWLLTAPESSHDIGSRKAGWMRHLRRIEERAEIPARLSMLRKCTQ